VEEFRLRTAAKEKPIMRVEDEFECPKTLWGSKEMVFERELHRIATASLMKLAGGTGTDRRHCYNCAFETYQLLCFQIRKDLIGLGL
jgi:hypothetical protein